MSVSITGQDTYHKLELSTNLGLLASQSVNSSSTPLYIGHTVELSCRISQLSKAILRHYNRLQWLDGGVAISNSTHRQLVSKNDTSLTLRISSFTVFDYGKYRCRCINMYSYEDEGSSFDCSSSTGNDTIFIVPRYYESEFIVHCMYTGLIMHAKSFCIVLLLTVPHVCITLHRYHD